MPKINFFSIIDWIVSIRGHGNISGPEWYGWLLVILSVTNKDDRLVFFCLVLLFSHDACLLSTDFLTSYSEQYEYLLASRNCSNIPEPIEFPNHFLTKSTSLVSFPRSGNYWVRTMIERSFGYLTSSIYENPHFFLPNSEHRQRKEFLVKTHDPLFCNLTRLSVCDLGQEEIMYDQIIRIVRNPFDSFLSYLQYQNRYIYGKNTTRDFDIR